MFVAARTSLPFSIARELETTGLEHDPQIMSRLAFLRLKADVYGFAVRDDSRLAYHYARGALPSFWNVDSVVQEMHSTDQLFQKTRYHSNSTEGLRILANELHTMYPDVPWGDLWKVVREYGAPAIKIATVRRDRWKYEYDCEDATKAKPAA